MIESLCLYLLCLSAALLCYTGFQNYSLIRSTSCSWSTCCFGLGFQLQNLQDFIKIYRALIKDIFPVAETVSCDLWNRPREEVQHTKLINKFIMSTPSVRTWPIRTVQVQMGSMAHPMSEPPYRAPHLSVASGSQGDPDRRRAEENTILTTEALAAHAGDSLHHLHRRVAASVSRSACPASSSTAIGGPEEYEELRKKMDEYILHEEYYKSIL